jgi:hypothetical protein
MFNCEDEALQRLKVDVVKRWQIIINDLDGIKNDSTDTRVAACNCREHKYFSVNKNDKQNKKDDPLLLFVPYWLTNQGLTRRVNGLSQDLCYDVAGFSMYVAALKNQAYAIRIICEEDDRVCPECLKYALGGVNGYYFLDEPLPPTPTYHFGCRCTWEIVFPPLM